jgi:hypothetical protein
MLLVNGLGGLVAEFGTLCALLGRLHRSNGVRSLVWFL